MGWRRRRLLSCESPRSEFEGPDNHLNFPPVTRCVTGVAPKVDKNRHWASGDVYLGILRLIEPTRKLTAVVVPMAVRGLKEDRFISR